MKKFNKVLSLLIAVVMVVTLSVSGVYAAGLGKTVGVTYEQLDPSEVTANLIRPNVSVETDPAAIYADTDNVRVIIVLEQAPAVSLYSGRYQFSAADVSAYRTELKAQQTMMAEYISEEALNGKKLDVVQNLTLVTNSISAVVEYGEIDEIAATEGVLAVFVEPCYYPMETETNNVISQSMTGAGVVQNSGYTGAGSRIAIIDTGVNTGHQSFAAGGYEYALAELAAQKGVSYEEYVASLNLLTVEEIADVLTELHVYKADATLTAEELYLNSKIPFAFNYADVNLYVGHEVNNDDGGHGSHVAGIAAANRYIECGSAYDFDGNGVFDMKDVQVVLNFVVGGNAVNHPDYADVSGDGSVTSYDVYLLMAALEEHEQGAHYISAAETVHVSGTAPDAQIIVMRVFGENGSTYASDYMAAVEDAITLGCDVINLSLGTSNPGFTSSHYSASQYPGWNEFIDEIMNNVSDTNSVLSVSAGNSYNWATYDTPQITGAESGTGMVYTDEGGNYSLSEPASYGNSLAVASVDNIGVVGTYELICGTENGAETIKIRPIISDNPTVNLVHWRDLDTVDADRSGTKYEIVFLGDPTGLFTTGVQTDSTIYGGSIDDFSGYDFTGKIVLIARGTYTFVDKHMNAALAGAAGVLIYNNEPGVLHAGLTGTTSNIPFGTLDLEDAKALYELFAPNSKGMYAGTLTVYQRENVDFAEDIGYYTMSDFSSWGATGALTLKPEITAPGGSIYSVEGMDANGSGYTHMSGTSMAAPHLSGLTALVSQYIKENGLVEKTGLTIRQLAQSLLMSTADPVVEELSDLEYSVRKQGAGLANVNNVVSSNAFITVDGQTDGKVKAELGDGTQDRTFTFTIHNFGSTELTYELSASMLTTDTQVIDGNSYMSDTMTTLDAVVTFSEDTVTVAAGESATVTVTISIPAKVANEMKTDGYTNGFYMEGFVYVNSVADSEGVKDVSHSIPLLGWYGNWSDPSMYDKGTYLDYFVESEQPGHIYDYLKNMLTWLPAGAEAQPYTGNIYAGISQDAKGNVILLGEQRYLEERNAISSNPDHWWEIYGIVPTLVRNVGDVLLKITSADGTKIYCYDDFEDMDDTLISSYFHSTAGWQNTAGSYNVGPDSWRVTDENGVPLAEGEEFIISLICVPEYYVENSIVDWENADLGDGIELSFRFTVDNTAPVLNEIDVVDGKLVFTAQDNNYIASAMLLNGAASMVYEYSYPDMDVDQKGNEVEFFFDLGIVSGQKVAIAICDYAGNETFYAVNLNGEGESYGELMGFQYDAGTWYSLPDAPTWTSIDLALDESGKEIVVDETAIFKGTTEFICAEYVNGHVYAQDKSGKFYGIPYADMLANSVDLDACYLTTLSRVYVDMAFDYYSGKLYAMYLYDSDREVMTEVYEISLESNWMSSAYTESNWPVFEAYSIYGLSFAMDDYGNPFILGMEVTMDWDPETWEDIKIIGETAHLWGYTAIDYGWYQMYDFADLGDTGMKMDFAQSMTFDHNSKSEYEPIYWARFYYSGSMTSALEKELVKLDISGLYNGDGTVNAEGTFTCEVIGDLSNETVALFVPLTEEAQAEYEHSYVPYFNPEVYATPVLSADSITLSKGESYALSCTFDPWYSNYTDVVWSTSDSSVAVVDQNGVVTAVSNGSCEIKVASIYDDWTYDTCTVSVASLTLSINGTITTSVGLNSVTDARLYDFSIVDGVVTYTDGVHLTASGDYAGYGMMIGAAVQGKDNELWVTEWGNSGMFYQVDHATGEIINITGPIGGNFQYGLSYSEATGHYTTISNFDMFVSVNLPLTEEDIEEMMPNKGDGYDQTEDNKLLNWHRLNLLPYLQASAGSFVTGETGNGASSEIVFCGITDIDNTYVPTGMYGPEHQYSINYTPVGDDMSNCYAMYTPDTIHVLLDNVGRLWYVDEIYGMSFDTDYYAYIKMDERVSDPMMVMTEGNSGIMAMENRDGTYNVFVIRAIEETALTDMFREGTMPRITYHFSDIYYAGDVVVWGGMVEELDTSTWEYVMVYKEYTAPVFYLSLYDYWNEGTENHLYLYIPSVETEAYDEMTWEPIWTPELLMKLGTTGEGNIIATITDATPADQIVGLPLGNQ